MLNSASLENVFLFSCTRNGVFFCSDDFRVCKNKETERERQVKIRDPKEEEEEV